MIPYTKLAETLRQVWPDFPANDWRPTYRGVEVSEICADSGCYHKGPVLGVQLRVDRRIGVRADIRRVMLVVGCVDTDVLKAKHAELEAIALKQDVIRNEEMKRSDANAECHRRVLNTLGVPDRWSTEIMQRGADTVTMKGTVTAAQLAALEAILGPQTVAVVLVVPEAKAVGVYRILKGR